MLRLVSNSDLAGMVAFSLVHQRARVDVPVQSVLRVDVMDDVSFVDTNGQSWRFPNIGVEIGLTSDISRHIYCLTRGIVGEPLDIVIGENCIASPIVREPICNYGEFWVSAYDLTEAEALATRIRRGTARPQLRIV